MIFKLQLKTLQVSLFSLKVKYILI